MSLTGKTEDDFRYPSQDKHTMDNELYKKIKIFEIRFIIIVLAKLQFSLIN